MPRRQGGDDEQGEDEEIERSRLLLSRLSDERINGLLNAERFFSNLSPEVRAFMYNAKPEMLKFLSEAREEEVKQWKTAATLATSGSVIGKFVLRAILTLAATITASAVIADFFFRRMK